MKKIVLILMLGFGFSASGQLTGWVPYASKNKHIGLAADSLMYMPVKDTTHTPQRLGAYTMRPQDSCVYVGISQTAGTQRWAKLAKYSDGTSWSLTGNSGTTPGTNFLGTTDSVDFVVKTKNLERIRINATGALGLGVSTPTSLLHVVPVHTTGIGVAVASSTTTSGSIMDITGTSTALAANNEGLNISISGENSNNAITATGARISVTNTTSQLSNFNIGLNVTASGAINDNFAITADGNVKITGAGYDASGTSSPLSVVGNAISTGNVIHISSSSISAGNVVNIVSTGTQKADGNEALNIRVSGSNITNGITATGARISVTNTNGTSGTNVGLEVSASGATTANYAIVVPASSGSVGIGTSSPSAILHSVGTARFDLGSDATGDIFYRNASGFFTRLPIGTSAQRLGIVGGLPAWTDTSAGGGGGWGTTGTVATLTGASTLAMATNTFDFSNGRTIFSTSGGASTPAISMTGNPYTAGTATTNHPLHYLNGGTAPTTWSTAGTYTGINAVSGFAGNFIDYHVNGGASVSKVDYEGTATFNGVTIGKYGGAKGFQIAGGQDMYFVTNGTLLHFEAGSAKLDIQIAGAGAYTEEKLTYGGNYYYNRTGSHTSLFNSGAAMEMRLGAGGTENYITIQPDGDVGIGQTSPAARLDILKTTEQLRISYDGSNYVSNTVSSAGVLTIAPTGASVTVTKPLVLKNYTVATLPAGVQGMICYVTDATAPTYGATLVGGGAVVTIAFYDGTNWTAH